MRKRPWVDPVIAFPVRADWVCEMVVAEVKSAAAFWSTPRKAIRTVGFDRVNMTIAIVINKMKSTEVNRLYPFRGPVGPITKKFVMASIIDLLKASSMTK